MRKMILLAALLGALSACSDDGGEAESKPDAGAQSSADGGEPTDSGNTVSDGSTGGDQGDGPVIDVGLDTSDSRPDATALDADAGPIDRCGDDTCQEDETCASCSADCGVCPVCEPTGAADCSTCTDCYWVATGGDDGDDGTAAQPWATLTHAIESIPSAGDVTICVADGEYSANAELDREFDNMVWLRSENPRGAILTAAENPALDVGSTNLTIEGFEILGQPTTGETQGLVYMWTAKNVLFQDNVIHDTYYNDLVRVLATEDVTFACNVFYNQASSDEHIDINNGATNTVFEDNIFFNDYAASGRTPPTDVHSFIVIKSSGDRGVSRDFFLRRNVFMSYEGGAKPHLRIGSDGEAFAEAEHVVIENNLFLLNGSSETKGAFEIIDASDVLVRANTFSGSTYDDEFLGFIGTGDGSPPSEMIRLHNNVFADAAGNMSALSDSPATGVDSGELRNNLYWNGGGEVPVTQGDFFDPADDATGVFADPALAEPAGATNPVWTGSGFATGHTTVREAFEAIVVGYATPGAGSAVLDAADASLMPADDILGRQRGDSPDIGAVETP